MPLALSAKPLTCSMLSLVGRCKRLNLEQRESQLQMRAGHRLTVIPKKQPPGNRELIHILLLTREIESTTYFSKLIISTRYLYKIFFMFYFRKEDFVCLLLLWWLFICLFLENCRQLLLNIVVPFSAYYIEIKPVTVRFKVQFW